jgi:F-type H+-transporting ATPase subunit delta
LNKRLGCEVKIVSKVDESLLGGAIIHAGDLVIDGSIQGRLGELATALSR